MDTKVVSDLLAALLALRDGALEALIDVPGQEVLQGLAVALREGACTIIS